MTLPEQTNAATDRLLEAAEALLAKIEATGYLVGTKEYVDLACAVTSAGAATPTEFRDVLLSIARTAYALREVAA